MIQKLLEEKVLKEIKDQTDVVDQSDSKKAILNYITTNLTKIVGSPENNTKALLMLNAALGILNVSDDPQSLSNARRIALAAFTNNKRGQK